MYSWKNSGLAGIPEPGTSARPGADSCFEPEGITKAASRNLREELESQNDKIQSLSFEFTTIYNN